MEWTEQYRPESLSDVRGNRSAIRDLKEWADTWESHRQAVILYGRPGIGKTTAAHALARDKSWQSIEMNASEQRTKDVVNKIAGGAANMGTLQGGVSGKRLVILDEADSLHGNVDRGGTGAMTSVVKEAEQPVVLIANDFYEMSNGIRNACEDIEFDLVDSRKIAQFLRDICDDQGIPYTTDALQHIAERSDGDVRGAVNDLQAVTATVTGELTVDDLPTGTRDRKENIFEFMDTLFKEGSPQEAQAAARSVDETPDSLFQWIEDNIVKEYNTGELHEAYTHLAKSDQWLGRVYSSDHNYTYWKYASDQMTVGVAGSRSGHHGSGWTRWGPPSFWRKLGSSRGKRDTRDLIAQRIGENSGVSMETARTEVLPYLSAITHHCKARDTTVSMTAVYDIGAKEISFITGSGDSTNKVESIVNDAEQRRSEAVQTATPGMDMTQTLQSGATGEEDTDTSSGTDTDENDQSQTTLSGTSDVTDDDTDETEETDHTQTTLF